MLQNEEFWTPVLKLPPIKWMLNTTLQTCHQCEKTHLETALDDYIDKNMSKCRSCNVYSSIIRFWINFLRAVFKIERNRVLRLFADSYSRRAVKSIVGGFIDYGVTHPLQVRAPLLVVWNFTYKCNLMCKHCYSDSGMLPRQELSTPEALNIVDQIADFGVTSLAFSGGEPLMRKDFFEIAAHAAQSGLYVSLATNGTLLNREIVKKLKRIGLNYVEISLDGAKSETHDAFRGQMGAFNQAITGLKNCMEQDVCTCLAVTATKGNLNEIPAIFELADQLGVDRFTLFNFVPTGRGKEILALDPSPEEREEILGLLYKKLTAQPRMAVLTTAPQLARVALQSSSCAVDDHFMPLAHMEAAKLGKQGRALASFIGGCGAGRFYCAISPEGNVQPCVFLPVTVGNLKEETFEGIWAKSPVFEALRDRRNLKGRCGRCQFKFVCGGCRARAYAYFSDYLKSDPGCIKRTTEGD